MIGMGGTEDAKHVFTYTIAKNYKTSRLFPKKEKFPRGARGDGKFT